MSWRNIVDWNPDTYTHNTHNTHNSSESNQKLNSAYSAYSAYKNEKQKKPAPDASPPPPTNTSEPEHTTEEEALIASFIDWVSHCQPGDEWEIPSSWLAETDDLRKSADVEVRKRNPELRVWRTGETQLVCKIFFGPELPPIRKSPNSNRFRKSSTNRIETMWNSEDGWCRWDSTKQDYVPDPSLNFDEIEGATTRNQ